MEPNKPQSAFTHFAKSTARASGQPSSFAVAVVVIAIWALTGPLFRFSDTWQLVINTGTTIVTFLMVFLIQNTQNREAEATQLKLDELIRAVRGAKNSLLDLEDMTDQELDEVRENYLRLASAARLQGERRHQQAQGAKTATAKKRKPT